MLLEGDDLDLGGGSFQRSFKPVPLVPPLGHAIAYVGAIHIASANNLDDPIHLSSSLSEPALHLGSLSRRSVLGATPLLVESLDIGRDGFGRCELFPQSSHHGALDRLQPDPALDRADPTFLRAATLGQSMGPL